MAQLPLLRTQKLPFCQRARIYKPWNTGRWNAKHCAAGMQPGGRTSLSEHASAWPCSHPLRQNPAWNTTARHKQDLHVLFCEFTTHIPGACGYTFKIIIYCSTAFWDFIIQWHMHEHYRVNPFPRPAHSDVSQVYHPFWNSNPYPCVLI